MLVGRLMIVGLVGLVSAGIAGEQFNVARVSLERGLSPNVGAVLQDDLGFLWVGTDQGLYRYHGQGADYFGAGGDNSLADASVRKLFQDSRGVLWVVTASGLNRYYPSQQKFRHFKYNPEFDEYSPGGNAIYGIAEGPDQNIWLAHNNGVDRFDPFDETFETYRLPQGEVENENGFKGVETLFLAKDGRLWAGDATGLAWYNQPQNRFERISFYSPISSKNAYVQRIADNPNGGLDVLYGSRLFRVDLETGYAEPYQRIFTAQSYGGDLRVYDFMRDRKRRLWVSGNFGILVYDRRGEGSSSLRHDPQAMNTLSYNEVNTLFEDRSGNIWAGTAAGLDRINDRKSLIQHVGPDPSRSGLASGLIFDVMHDRYGRTFLATNAGISITQRRNRIKNYTAREGEEVYALAPGPSNQIFALTSQRVVKLYGDQWKVVSELRDVKLAGRLHFLAYHRGKLWLAGYEAPLMRLDLNTEKWTKFGHDPEDETTPASDLFSAMHLGEDGKLYLTGGNVLNRFDPQDGTTERIPLVDRWEMDEFKLDVTHIHLTSDQTLWLATNFGLIRFEYALQEAGRKPYTYFTKAQGIARESVLGVIDDKKGNLWLAHRNAVSRFNPKEMASLIFDFNDGLNNRLIRGGVSRDMRGNIYFNGTNGYNFIDPIKSYRESTPPRVVITGFRSDNPDTAPIKNAWMKPNLELGYKDRKLFFSLAALDFTNPEKHLFRYRLKGFDSEWSVPRTNPEFAVENPGQGHFVLEVAAANSDGVWSTETATMPIYIKVPWWRSNLALLAYAILIPLLLFTSHRWRTHKLRVRAVELEGLVEDRTRGLREEKEKTERQAARLLELDTLKTQFFSNVSHEFRTPLTLIIGPLENLIARALEAGRGEDARHYEVMLRNARRLLRLINQLLDISKLEAGKMKLHASPEPIAAFVRPIVGAFRSLADKRGIALELVDESAEQPLYFDGEKLEKVLFNILSNAFQFTPDGGAIVLTLKPTEQNGKPALLLELSDSGVGIPKRDLPFLFDRFRQADGSTTRGHEGTGIGLSLVKELVELHGGQVALSSVEGEGTVVSITLLQGRDHLDDDQVSKPNLELPDNARGRALVEMAHLEEAQHQPQLVRNDGLGETILIVDDHPDVRAYVRVAFQQNYRTLEAEDGRQGLELARRHKPDLIISDVMMPNMDGYDMCRALKGERETAHIPIILLTARATDDMKVEGLEIGADDYLGKPFNVRELQVRVRNLLAIRGQERSLRKSLEMAHRVQTSMLPPSVPHIKGLDIASFSQPAREVGGDYYDFVPHGDSRLGIIIGDVSGKGMPAALYMTMTKGLVQAVGGSETSPKRALTAINKQFRKASDAYSFISLLYAVIDADARKLVFSSAGHTPMIHHSEGKTSYVKARGMAVGIEDGRLFDRVVGEHELEIKSGDTFVLYTDGITEAMNASQETFGEQRLLDLVAGNGDADAAALLNRIQEAYSAFVGSEEQSDDMTAVVIRAA